MLAVSQGMVFVPNGCLIPSHVFHHEAPIVLAFESPHLRFSSVVSAPLALQISPSRPSAASVLLSLLLHISSASSWRKFSLLRVYVI